MEKINVADLLMGCPQGMKLDCVMFDDVVFEEVDFSFFKHPVVIRRTDTNTIIHLTKYGQYIAGEGCKCVIFPENKTTWEGFVPPCKYKNGDIVITTLGSTAIIKEPVCNTEYYAHCVWVCGKLITDDTIGAIRFATESEKAELFKAIKENGYKWNEETKKLEKVSQYPQTLEKCCAILGLTELGFIGGYRRGLLTQFRNLLICRDAYWKIADDWKFNFEEKCYYLCNEYHEIQDFNGVCDCNAVLAFPTAEMRDAFYDNFEELIKECKSLL